MALLASLLVAVPGPIKAQDPEPDYLASFDACPEDVIPDADFTDVRFSHPNVGDIDCIAYYGITKGTSAPGAPPTYSPEDWVIREHMALFLVRLARKVGIDIPPPGTTPFTDTANLSQDSRDAISQIYQLRITGGATNTTYAPARDVSRGEMALFLQRLMDEMDPVVDGRDDHGYRPEDVDDEVIDDADVESPFRDLLNATREVDEAVTQLYELGVASGTSETTYGPEAEMSRAAMAEFMAAILDHSNLRPAGMTVQLTPMSGLDDYDITAMITVRDGLFRPVDNRVVDYFYTADPDAGLQQNGECDEDVILDDGDCVWDEDEDEETDPDGNIFVEFTAEPGENMTFYAWVGRGDGDEFDADSVDYHTAASRSSEGPDSLLITTDIPANAALLEPGVTDAQIVDLDRQDAVEFTIRLLGESGNNLALEGVEIGVDIFSEEIVVNAAVVSDGEPAPTYQPVGGDDEDELTLVTDEDGEATFELEGPRSDERLDTVTIFTECCEELIEIAWSDGETVLFNARPEFDRYVLRAGSGSTSVKVEYQLYDQYGNELRGVTESRTGRTGTFQGTLEYNLYTKDGQSVTDAVDAKKRMAHKVNPTRGRITETLQAKNAPVEGSYFLLTPQIFSDKEPPSNEDPPVYVKADDIAYATEPIVVWVVDRASSDPSALLESDRKITSCDLMPPGVTDVTLDAVEVFPREDNFRTCFTLWRYRQDDRFLKDSDTLTVTEFEAELEALTDANKIEIVIYSTRSSVRRIFKIHS